MQASDLVLEMLIRQEMKLHAAGAVATLVLTDQGAPSFQAVGFSKLSRVLDAQLRSWPAELIV